MNIIRDINICVKKPRIRTIKDFLSRIKNSIYCSSNLVLWSVNTQNFSKPDIDEKTFVKLKVLKDADLTSITNDFGADLVKKFSEWLKTYNGFLITYKERVIGYCWSTNNIIKKQGSYPLLFNIRPNEGYYYAFGDYIIPEMRGKGMNSILAQYRLYQMRKNGFKREFGFVDVKNIPQTKIMKKFGWENYGNLQLKKFFWKKTRKFSGIEECCKISFFKK